jgi:uncharacterized protein YwgA
MCGEELKMAFQFAERWNQYGIIAELASRLTDVSPQFGKTVLQKLVYILQEVYKVPCDYDYILFNYGPYSDGLAEDLSFFTSMEGVRVEWSKNLGYEISPARRTDHFRERAQVFLEQYQDKITEVIRIFGGMSARELELRSTVIYVSKEKSMDKESLASRVKEIKPHFSEYDVKSAIKELECLNMI